MPSTRRFVISESGYVYAFRRIGKHGHNHRRNPLRLLGHISCLLKDETHLGDEIRRWWTVYLESDCSLVGATSDSSRNTTSDRRVET
jgi:hypothetical protein